jgi:hypothetical protein
MILFRDIIYKYRNKLERLSLARLTHKLRLGWKALAGTNTLAYFATTVSYASKMFIKSAPGDQIFVCVEIFQVRFEILFL